MAHDTFGILILNGRPASGKSEVIDFLKQCPVESRRAKFHIGEFDELDDFPILWERFEDDDIYERHGKPRLISDTHFTFEGKQYPGYVFKDQFFWNFLIEKFNLEYSKRLRDDPDSLSRKTLLIEFSRGSEHGGFQTAYQYLSDAILERAATLYIDCSWEESLRKNARRFNPDKPDSILEHALEDKKLEMLYRESDWESFASSDPDYILVKGHSVPYATFQNDPEITDQPDALASHLEEVLNRLWNLRNRA
ncbi:MAG: hypothetical protein JW829_12085 [Pirellulales bacterium]|nr:hypothetical protein [Pirellulales bacterium]